MEKTSERTNVTVSVRDLFLYLCSRWRVLLIWLVIGAVLGGAYSGYKSLKSANGSSSSETVAAMYDNMSETDKTNVQNNITTFIHYINQYEFYSMYDEKSLFQKLNPDTAKVGVLTYHLATDNDDLDNIVRIYAANITNEEFVADVAAKFNVSLEDAFYYYDGIVRVGDNNIVIKITDSTASTEVKNMVNAPLIIRIYGESEEFVEDMMELVKNSVDRISKSMSGFSKDYAAELMNETIRKNDDSYIYDRQEEYVANTKQVLKDCTSLKDSLESDLLTAVRYYITEQYDGDYLDVVFPGISDDSSESSFHISKKWLVFGAAVLFILAVLVIIIKYLVKGVVRCYDDIEYAYGIQVLGTYDDPKTAFKEHKSSLDKWLKSLRIKRKSQDREASAALIARKLQLLANNHDLKNICVAIGPDVDTDDNFMEDVVQNADGINVTVAFNILRNADAISKVLEADGVVLLEQMDRSRFSAIDEERVMCAGNNINILGAIVAE